MRRNLKNSLLIELVYDISLINNDFRISHMTHLMSFQLNIQEKIMERLKAVKETITTFSIFQEN